MKSLFFLFVFIFAVSCTKSLEEKTKETTNTENTTSAEAPVESESPAETETEKPKVESKQKTTKKEPKLMENLNTMNIELKDGTVKVKLRPDLAPNHVKRVKELTQGGFYNGLKFHRVIDGFMAQTGDPRGDGTGGSELPDLKAEFTDTSFKRGTLGMARSQNPDSANSQFFIMFAEAPHLNGQYTVFGEVTEGMDLVDKIKKGPASENGTVPAPADTMVKVTLSE